MLLFRCHRIYQYLHYSCFCWLLRHGLRTGRADEASSPVWAGVGRLVAWASALLNDVLAYPQPRKTNPYAPNFKPPFPSVEMFTYYTCRNFHKVLTPLHNRVLKQRDPQLVDNRVHSNVNNLTPLETEVEIRICSSPLKVGQFRLLLIMLAAVLHSPCCKLYPRLPSRPSGTHWR